jgi:hypothetical protein
MKIKNVIKKHLLLALMLAGCLVFETAEAWEHEISIGYGRSKEINYDYYNSGFFLNGKLYKFNAIDKTLIFTIDASVAHWNASTENYKTLNAAALSGAFRAYFISPENRVFNPYLAASFGPAYLSQNKFGEREQGAHLSFQTTLGFGAEILQKNKHGFDLNLQLAHYCNAGLFNPNRGINILYVFSIGYMF